MWLACTCIVDCQESSGPGDMSSCHSELAPMSALQDKVNISVAIIPMAQDFGWSPTTSGFVQSSFFFGYMLSQIPGGYVVSRRWQAHPAGGRGHLVGSHCSCARPGSLHAR